MNLAASANRDASTALFVLPAHLVREAASRSHWSFGRRVLQINKLETLWPGAKLVAARWDLAPPAGTGDTRLQVPEPPTE